MYSPQFLAQLRAYLASGGKEDFGGGSSPLTPTPMPEEDALSKGITAGMSSFKQHSVPQDTKLKTYIPGGATREQMPIPMPMRQPLRATAPDMILSLITALQTHNPPQTSTPTTSNARKIWVVAV